MFNIDLIIIIGILSLLFLRHTAVYKDPNKINYTPIVFGLGAGGGIAHFLFYAQSGMEMSILKESLLVLGIGIVLSAIMSVLSRSVASSMAFGSSRRVHSMSDEIVSLKSALETFSTRIETVAQMEDATHEQLRNVFKEELDALNVVQANQKLFVSKIEELLAQQHNAMQKFEDFTLTELPGLDNVIHRHIDLLRIAEQDHYNHIKSTLKQFLDENKESVEQISNIHEQISRIETKGLGEQTLDILHKELERIVREFGSQLHSIGAKSESIGTTLLENDAILKGSREQSELIMQQMVLSSKQMKELSSQSKELSDSFKPLVSLLSSAQTLHQEFADAKGKLNELVVTLESYDRQEYRAFRDNLERLTSETIVQIQLLKQTIEQHRPAPVDMKNIQELSGKVRLQRSYIGENQE